MCSPYCLTSSQLHTHTLIHGDNFIGSFNDIQKHSPRHTTIVTIILYTDTKTSLVDEHLGRENNKKHLLKIFNEQYFFSKKHKLAAMERVSDQARS
jgi:hypothetical protein